MPEKLLERMSRRRDVDANPFNVAQYTKSRPRHDPRVEHVSMPALRPTAAKNSVAHVDIVEEASYCPPRSRSSKASFRPDHQRARVRSRARVAFVPVHVLAARIRSRTEEGLIVGSPPDHRYNLLKRARKYDKEW